jgi:hypothetical protein
MNAKTSASKGNERQRGEGRRFDSQRAREAARKSAEVRRRKKAGEQADAERFDPIRTLREIASNPKAPAHARVQASKLLAQTPNGSSSQLDAPDLEQISAHDLEAMSDAELLAVADRLTLMAKEYADKAEPLSREEQAELDAWREAHAMAPLGHLRDAVFE